MKWSAILLTLMMLVPVLMVIVPSVHADDIPENMPIVPPEQVQYVCPNEVMTAHSLQWNNYSGESVALADWVSSDPAPGTTNFTGINFGYPYPNSTGVTVLEDKLWINELAPTNLFTLLGAGLPDQDINPLIVLDADNMTNNQTELYNYLVYGLTMWIANGTINDRSWFPSYLLDFRIYYSAYVNLEPLGRDNITVFGFGITNCSRETYWQETDSFLYAYYTTQKKYEATLQVENNISTSHYYDVNWYVGYPANRLVDPATLRVRDLDNDLYLTLGQHYDCSNAGVWMSFTRINMSEVRSFTFSIYAWNATIGIGTAIAYADTYEPSKIGTVDYYKSVPTWTNNYGRVYQGAVFIQLSFEEGKQRYIDPSSVKIYDTANGAFLEAWQFAVNGGLIVVEYTIVPVGSELSYDVYFKIDYNQMKFDIFAPLLVVFGIPISLFVFLVLAWIALFVWTLVNYSPNKLMVMLIFGSMIGGYYILYALGYV